MKENEISEMLLGSLICSSELSESFSLIANNDARSFPPSSENIGSKFENLETPLRAVFCKIPPFVRTFHFFFLFGRLQEPFDLGF